MKTWPFAAAALLAACVETTPVPVEPVRLSAAELERIKALLVYDFKDPSSAQFRGLKAYRVRTGDTAVCGQVNGKNSFGAYIGYKTFYIRVDGSEVKRKLIDQESLFWASAACKEAQAGALSIATSELSPAPG